MVAPNLIAPANIIGKSTYVKCSNNNGLNLILENPAGSNKVFKINSFSIMFSNGEPYQYASQVYIKTNAGQSAETSYTYDALQIESSSHVNIPTRPRSYLPLKSPNQSSRWKVISKDESIYLCEGESIHLAVSGGTQNDVHATISYEEIT